MAEENEKSSGGSFDLDRRDFLKIGAAGAAVVAGGGAAIPFIRSMSPSLDVESQRTVEVDISGIKEGDSTVVEWQGKPVFVVHRDKTMIDEAKKYDGKGKDKEGAADADRVKKPEWLVVLGVCTHLGCTPLWKPGEEEWKAWHCPCHGSMYDYSGRIVSGPAPKNLEVPEYEFIGETKLQIGKAEA